MGISQTDIDKDGDMDYYLSNIGNSMKVSKLSRGNLKDDEILTHDHILLRNDGNFKFIDIGKQTNVANAGFSWGPVFTDLNLDGYDDLLVSQNFAQLASQVVNPLPSQRWIYDKTTNKFVKSDKYPNRSVGQTPLSMDIDDDNINDVVWVNMIGQSRVYKVKNDDNNNFINVKIPDTLDFANSKIIVKTPNNEYVKEYIIGGVGLSSDTPSTLQFGIGKEENVEKVTIKFANPKFQEITIDNPTINSTLVGITSKMENNQMNTNKSKNKNINDIRKDETIKHPK